jgi:dienelactone hydrolase
MLCLRLLHGILLASLLAAGASAAETPAVRTVDLKTSDGVVLKASYFPAAKPGPGVLLLHQCNRQRNVWDQLAGQLQAAGINVLTFDLRGFGESGGNPHDKNTPQEEARVETEKWPGDIDIAFDYLASQPEVTRDDIGVGGASCGFDNSIQSARRHPQQVKSLVLLSGGTDFQGREFLRHATQPQLFGYAEDDGFRPTVESVPWLFVVSASSGKKLARYATGGHGSDIFYVHPELRQVIVDWYVTTLSTTPGHAPAAENNPQVPASAGVLNDIELPGGVERTAAKLAEARRRDPKVQIFPEGPVNFMGYEYLQAGDRMMAIAILKLNAEAFPSSPNVYDSLGDADLADGQKDLARQNAKKALELLASDTRVPENLRNAIRNSAEQKLKQLDAQQ